MGLSIEEIKSRMSSSDDEIGKRIDEYKPVFERAVESFVAERSLTPQDDFPEFRACASGWYPTHPGGYTKRYELGLWVCVQQNQRVMHPTNPNFEPRMPKASDITMSQLVPSEDGSTVNPINAYTVGGLDARSLYCFAAPNASDDYFNRISQSTRTLEPCRFPPQYRFTLMSDTFVNELGELVRGYWLSEYEDPASEEYNTPDTAYGVANAYGNSIGREILAIYNGNLLSNLDGDTRMVECKEFDFVGPLLDGDQANIDKYIARAKSTHERSGPSNLLFKRKP